MTVCNKTRFKVWRGQKETRVYVHGRYSHRKSAAQIADGTYFCAGDDGMVRPQFGAGETRTWALRALAEDCGFNKMTFAELVAHVEADQYWR